MIWYIFQQKYLICKKHGNKKIELPFSYLHCLIFVIKFLYLFQNSFIFRRLTDLQEQLTELQQEFDVSKEECSGHHKVIQELKLNLEEVKSMYFYLDKMCYKTIKSKSDKILLLLNMSDTSK